MTAPSERRAPHDPTRLQRTGEGSGYAPLRGYRTQHD